jgi:hypothetical protein
MNTKTNTKCKPVKKMSDSERHEAALRNSAAIRGISVEQLKADIATFEANKNKLESKV